MAKIHIVLEYPVDGSTYTRLWNDPSKGEVSNTPTLNSFGASVNPRHDYIQPDGWIDLSPEQVEMLNWIADKWQVSYIYCEAKPSYKLYHHDLGIHVYSWMIIGGVRTQIGCESLHAAFEERRKYPHPHYPNQRNID
jgi:hypothetical protein